MKMRVMDILTAYAQETITVVENQRGYEFEVDDLLTEFPEAEVLAIYGNTQGTISITIDVLNGLVEATWLEVYAEA